MSGSFYGVEHRQSQKQGVHSSSLLNNTPISMCGFQVCLISLRLFRVRLMQSCRHALKSVSMNPNTTSSIRFPVFIFSFVFKAYSLQYVFAKKKKKMFVNSQSMLFFMLLFMSFAANCPRLCDCYSLCPLMVTSKKRESLVMQIYQENHKTPTGNSKIQSAQFVCVCVCVRVRGAKTHVLRTPYCQHFPRLSPDWCFHSFLLYINVPYIFIQPD